MTVIAVTNIKCLSCAKLLYEHLMWTKFIYSSQQLYKITIITFILQKRKPGHREVK